MLNVVGNRRGIALPLALLGLVVVSFLVVSAIVTSGAELTGSSAQQQATAALYRADDALGRYVSAKAAAAAAETGSLAPTSSGGDPVDGGFRAHVALLFNEVGQTATGTMFQNQRYAVTVLPESGRGRSVGSFVHTRREADPFTIAVDAGLTVGGDVNVTGNSTISDGRDATNCDSTMASQYALEVSSGSTISIAGSADIRGGTNVGDYDKTQMVERILGGMTIEEAVRYANVKFGPGEFNGRSRSHDSGVPRPRTNKYNWGCPSASTLPCTTYEANADNMNYYPMVAIDANNASVTLEGDHGQGVLIIHNGSAEIRGNLVYQGVVVVQRDLTVRGTSGGGAVKIEGAVVALGENSVVEDNTSGNATIVYNQCVNAQAQEGANEHRLRNAPQVFTTGTTNWFELLR